MSGTPDLLTSSGDAMMFSSVAALVAAFNAGGSCAGRITRRIVAHSSGLMQIKLAGNGGAAMDWYFIADFVEDLQCTGFTSTGATLSPSASTPIKVYF